VQKNLTGPSWTVRFDDIFGVGMTTDSKTLRQQTSDGYRSARRITSIFCAIAFAWSAAQFDLTLVNFGFIGSVGLAAHPRLGINHYPGQK
jgi:hypothetical protein